MFGQAMIERGMLEGLSFGVSNILTGVGDAVQTHPFLTILFAAMLGFALVRRR